MPASVLRPEPSAAQPAACIAGPSPFPLRPGSSIVGARGKRVKILVVDIGALEKVTPGMKGSRTSPRQWVPPA